MNPSVPDLKNGPSGDGSLPISDWENPLEPGSAEAPESPSRRGLAGVYFIALFVLYGILGLALMNAPLQDLPNHLARAHIISDLLFNAGRHFGTHFDLNLSFNPYLGGDLILAVGDKLLGASMGASLWIAASLLLLPLGASFALTQLGVSRAMALTGGMLSFYLATSWFFAMGFMNFELAFACAIFTYGWFLKAKVDPRPLPYTIYLLMVIVSYTLHLSALIFICAFVGVQLLWDFVRGKVSFARAALLIAGPAALLVLHLLFAIHQAPGSWPTSWGTVGSKLLYVGSPAIRFNLAVDMAFLFLFLAVALFPVFRRRFAISSAEFAPLLLIAATFFALYILLPSYTGNVYSVDVRALPYAFIFLVFAGVVASGTRGTSPALARVQLVLAAVFAGCNLAYVAYELLPQNHALGLYRAIAVQAPPDAHVLPIDTRPAIGRYRPFIHAGSFATLEGDAITPYLFAADQNPPMNYFQYHTRDKAPNAFWYTNDAASGRAESTAVWDNVMLNYQFMLVTVPWDRKRIPIPYTVVASNEVAALLKISRP